MFEHYSEEWEYHSISFLDYKLELKLIDYSVEVFGGGVEGLSG